MAREIQSISIANEAEEEDDEALSLCDLPISEANQSRKQEEEEEEAPSIKTKIEEDFDFGSLGGSVWTEPAMCAADDVFFRGQILPLRHSISSDSCLAALRKDSRNPSRCVSRSESMDHCYSSSGFTSVSSRSSSIRSHNSSSSASSTSAAAAIQKQRIRNQFHSHPSPTPQIRVSSSRYGNVGGHRSSTSTSTSHKSTLWSFFRVGLVRAPWPEIELQDLKVRNNSTRSFGSRNSTSSTSSSKNGSDIDKKKKKKQRLMFSKNGGLLFGGCKCSVNAVNDRTVPSRVVVMVNSSPSNNGGQGNERKDEKAVKQKKTKQQNGKQTMSRHRTFEWLKELSLAGVPNEA
ncbi:hypothetical protein CsSME_00003634 [Camellia sinensis var. sinensis]